MSAPQLTTGAPPVAPDLVTTAPRPAIRGRSRGGPSRLRALDGLRLLAALMVAAYHFGGRNGEIAQAWAARPPTNSPPPHRCSPTAVWACRSSS